MRIPSFVRRCAAGLALGTAAAQAGEAQGAAVVGVAYDSIGHAPLGAAIVQLVDAANRARSYSATADARGSFRVDGVPPGRYLIGLLHPTLDLLGLDPTLRMADVGADTLQHLDLFIPNGTRVRRALCGDAVDARSGVLVGQVRDADTGAPLDSARLALAWIDIVIAGGKTGVERRQQVAPVRGEGYFAVCGASADDDIEVTIDAPGHASAELRVRADSLGVTRRDFTLGPITPSASGRARVSGVVRRPDGRPAAGATVLVPGTDERATADDEGRFALSGLPSGTHLIEARAIGFEPRSVIVDLAAGAAVETDVALGRAAQALETVKVYGRGSRFAQLQQAFFERSRRSGAGSFVTAETIARRGATDATSALEHLPGIFIASRGMPPATPNGPPRQVFMRSPKGNGYCSPAVYIDGFRVAGGGIDIDVLVNPANVIGFEVYRPATAPAEYAPTSTTGCGVILVWSR